MPSLDPTLARRCADTLRFLAVDMVQAANSGHPGAPLGMADLAFVLWQRHLRHDPDDPSWLARDRFVLSNGHASSLLYALLHLSGYALDLEQLKRFRQWDSLTPGHPERGLTPGVESTTGPLGQGIATAIGMALAAKMLRARLGAEGFDPLPTRVWVLAGDGDMMEGVTAEAASLAGHLRLDNLIVCYDDNRISIEGPTSLAFSEDVAARFEALGWQVLRAVDGHDQVAIAAALEQAVAAGPRDGRPVLVICRTEIGHGSPRLAGTAEVHGTPLGDEERRATKQARGWPLEPPFLIPEEVRAVFAARREQLRRDRQGYEQGLARWLEAQPAERVHLWEQACGRAPADPLALREALLAALGSAQGATRKLSGQCLQLLGRLPLLVGGSADLAPSTATLFKDGGDVGPGSFGGRNLRFGIREHGMAAIVNGLNLFGGLRAFGATFLVFSDYLRPALRLAALMHAPSIFVLTHDSVFLGEDGPTHQPVEHLWALRAIPGVTVWRPGDGVETALAWLWALSQPRGPSVLALSRQTVAPVPRQGLDPELIWRGGYVLREAPTAAATLVATGSELGLAVQAADLLAGQGLPVRLVSMPCVELFVQQPTTYRAAVLGDRPLVTLEAGTTRGWQEVIGCRGLHLGLDRFGASAPDSVLAERFGLTPAAVAQRVKDFLAA